MRSTTLLLFVIGLMAVRVVSQDWEWQNPLPQGSDLHGVVFANPDTGWAIGLRELLRTIDGGTTWSISERFNAEWSTRATITPNGTGWIAAGSVWKSTDSGATWDSVSIQPTWDGYSSICFVDDCHGWVGAISGSQIARTTDGGESWTYHDVAWHSGVLCISFVDSLNGWAPCGSCSQLMRTRDGGQTWTEPTSSLNIHHVLSFVDTLVGWSARDNLIKRTEDGGVTWITLFDSTGTCWNDLISFGADTVWAAGNTGIMHTTDGGASWTVDYETGPCGSVNRLTFVNHDIGCAVGTHGLLLRTNDGGNSWQELSRGGYCNVRAACFVDSLRGWVAGAEGTILNTVDGGAEWQVHTSIFTGDLRSVSFPNHSNGLVGGNHGTILRTDDGGVTWNDRSCETTQSINSIALLDSLHGWAMGAGGPVFYTEDGGEIWLERLPEHLWVYERLSAVSPDEAWVLIEGSCALHTLDAGATWDSITFFGVYDLRFTDSLHGWALAYSADRSNLIYTHDGGETWVPRLVGQADSVLEELYALDSLTVWVKGVVQYHPDANPEFILRTSDGGDHWDAYTIDGYPADLAIADSTHVWVIGPESRILKFSAGSPVPVSEIRAISVPVSLSLSAYPNPFNPTTTLSFDLPQAGRVNLKIYDITGRIVEDLVSRVMPAGTHQAEWNAEQFASGIYFVNLQTANGHSTQKVILLK